MWRRSRGYLMPQQTSDAHTTVNHVTSSTERTPNLTTISTLMTTIIDRWVWLVGVVILLSITLSFFSEVEGVVPAGTKQKIWYVFRFQIFTKSISPSNNIEVCGCDGGVTGVWLSQVVRGTSRRRRRRKWRPSRLP